VGAVPDERYGPPEGVVRDVRVVAGIVRRPWPREEHVEVRGGIARQVLPRAGTARCCDTAPRLRVTHSTTPYTPLGI
jgi:hypothetical protein